MQDRLLDNLAEALHALRSQAGGKKFHVLKEVTAAMFQIIDSRNLGFITRGEFASFTKVVAEQCSMWSPAEADFRDLDTSGDQRIDYDELHTFLRAACKAVGTRQFVAQMGMAGELLRKDELVDMYRDLKVGQGCVIMNTEERAITLAQLRALFAHMKRRCQPEGWVHRRGGLKFGPPLAPAGINLYHAVDYVIKPATSGRACSYVEFVADGPQRPCWFVSHFWGEPVKDFIACLAQHSKDRQLPEDSPYWVCAYANNQWDLEAELDADPAKSSFRRAMQLSQGTVSIIDQDAVCFNRIWCCYEVWVSIYLRQSGEYMYDMYTVAKTGAVGITDGCAEVDRRVEFPNDAKYKREKTFPMDLCRKALSIRLQDADASSELDRHCILNSIIGAPKLAAIPPPEHERYEELNGILRGLVAVATWRDSMETGQPMELHLAALSKSNLPKLEVSFDSSSLITDKGMKDLLATTTAGLQELNLDLSFCAAISDKTLRALSEAVRVPTGLRKVTLSFMVGAARPSPLTDTGLMTLAKALPDTTEWLDLNFHGCKALTDKGFGALLAALPRQLSGLALDFAFNPNITSQAVNDLAASLPDVRVLKLNLSQCYLALKDYAIRALGRSLPASLAELHLDLRCGEDLTDAGVAAIFSAVSCSAPGLRVLSVNCNWCKQLTDKALPTSFPEQLRTLSLGFDWCSQITDFGLCGIAWALPPTLQELVLQLNGCNHLTEGGAQALARSLPKGLRRIELWLTGCLCAKRAEELVDAALEDLPTEVLVHRSNQTRHTKDFDPLAQ